VDDAPRMAPTNKTWSTWRDKRFNNH